MCGTCHKEIRLKNSSQVIIHDRIFNLLKAKARNKVYLTPQKATEHFKVIVNLS
jgi:hypothetical protein